MSIQLRPHQTEAVNLANVEIAKGSKNTLIVLPTGAGKTIVKAHYAREFQRAGEPTVVFAHRDVLLGQISDALCMLGVYHTLMVSGPTLTQITNDNLEKHGNSFYDPRSIVIVASVDKFYRSDLSTIAPIIKWWMLDECHHLTNGSKWHKCLTPLTNARGIGVTATPIRGDKKGLGRDYDGVFDSLVVGSSMGELIARGMLTKYRIFRPPTEIDITGMSATASGDLNQKELAKRTDKSNITGDVIKHYLQIAAGKRAICFTVNIDHSNHVAQQMRQAGIRAVSLSSKDSSSVRNAEIAKFRNGVTDVLVNCDLFGEGFDVPAVECVIMLRKTLSYSLYKQQFGRCLRVLPGKEYGILIDHVGNVEHHMTTWGLDYPHDDPQWTLERQPKASKTKADPKPLRVCPECFNQYIPTTANNHQCPACQHVETKKEEIDALIKFQEKQGKLVEMDLDFTQKMKDKRKAIDVEPEVIRNKMQYAGARAVVVNSAVKNHGERKAAQQELRAAMKEWLDTACFNEQLTMETTARAFEVTFGINVYQAQVLGAKEARELTKKVIEHEGY